MIKYFFLISCFLYSNPFLQWINEHSDILNKEIKSINFTLKIHSNDFTFKEDSVLIGKLIVNNKKQFRFELGPRIIISNGKYWKSYDLRTNQIILHEKDKKIEKTLLSLFKYKYLKSVPIKLIDENNYTIKFFDKWTRTTFSFESGTIGIKRVIVKYDNNISEISSISLKEELRINLEIGDKNTEIFDFR